MPRALITGPTSGLGRAFAEEFARHGMDLVLVSRDNGRLAALGQELRDRFGVHSEIFALDLADRDGLQRVEQRLRETDIAALVNNAGFGLSSTFHDSDIADEQRALDTMVTAVLRLTHAALPGMLERNRGMVINVSSIAGWIAGGTYSAAKAWVTVFTEGLANGVSGSRVRVVAVCPGFVRTEFHDRAGLDVQRIPAPMWLTSTDVVRQAFRDLSLGNVISVTGAHYRVLSIVLQSMPRQVVRSASRLRRSVVRAQKRPGL
jgi:short-subunit dehydrogenase